MTRTNAKSALIVAWLAAITLLSAQGPAGAQETPGEWLDKMAHAVTSTNYQGTVIRRQRGESEALKVVRKTIDGVVNERVSSQEGHGLEIIRIGDEVHCILPNKKSVLVEGWNNQSTLFSVLPRSEITRTPQYDLSLIREGRIAGRPAVLLAVRPHDAYRFGHRIWLDEDSGFPLQTELLDINGEVIEEIKFADITISDDIASDELDPSISLEGFTWYRDPARYESVSVQTEWVCDDLPAGFRILSTNTEKNADDPSEPETTHIVYSDGVANISVFISERDGEEKAGWAMVGTSNSFTVDMDGYEITAFGEVPGVTVQRVASSMHRK